MKKYFFTGFIALLPLALTLIVVVWLFNLFTAPLAGIMESLIISYEEKMQLGPEHHAHLVLFLSRVLALILLVALIFLLGVFGQKFLFKNLINLIEKVFSKIPIIRGIFKFSHDLTKAVFSGDKKTFKETILLPFPHKEAHAIGFVVGDVPSVFREKNPHIDLVVFVPTAPHPISGFLLFAPKAISSQVDLSVEEAFKFLISCGTLYPGENIPSADQAAVEKKNPKT